ESDLDAPSASCRGERALLVVFLVVGDVRFGHDAAHAAAVQDCRTVEEAVMDDQRQADHGQAGEDLTALLREISQRLQRPIEENRLSEQVAASVAGEAQLRKDDDGSALRLGLAE